MPAPSATKTRRRDDLLALIVELGSLQSDDQKRTWFLHLRLIWGAVVSFVEENGGNRELQEEYIRCDSAR
jgi:hypothetical protein